MTFTETVTRLAQAVDALGIGVIVAGILVASGVALRGLTQHRPDVYRDYRRQLGQSILLGLELLVAADIVRTVAVSPTFEGVGVLALIVVVRTFLSFTLELETTGRWPWQKGRDAAPG